MEGGVGGGQCVRMSAQRWVGRWWSRAAAAAPPLSSHLDPRWCIGSESRAQSRRQSLSPFATALLPSLPRARQNLDTPTTHLLHVKVSVRGARDHELVNRERVNLLLDVALHLRRLFLKHNHLLFVPRVRKPRVRDRRFAAAHQQRSFVIGNHVAELEPSPKRRSARMRRVRRAIAAIIRWRRRCFARASAQRRGSGCQ